MKKIILALTLATASGLAAAQANVAALPISGYNENGLSVDARYVFDVRNVGTIAATNVVGVYTLPRDSTVLAFSSGSGAGCTFTPQTAQNPPRYTCHYGNMNAGRRYQPVLRLTTPPVAGTQTIAATISASNDAVTTNNTASIAVNYQQHSNVVAAPDDLSVTVCAGSGPFSFSQCTASSFIINTVTLGANNEILDGLTPIGMWSQPTGGTGLTLEFFDQSSQVVARFNMTGTASANARCFQGPGTYPLRTTPWYSQMRACLL